MHSGFSSFFTTFTFILLIIFMTFLMVDSDPIHLHSLLPNFTTTSLGFYDTFGAFLSSQNSTFRASLHNPFSHNPSHFYFSVIHVPTNTIVWSANRDVPVYDSATLALTTNGLTISEGSNKLIWSTPPLSSSVSALRLYETGNLVLVDANGVPLWQSFDHPTDTIVMGQRLPVGTWLVSRSGEFDLSAGSHRLEVTGDDLVLRWLGRTYWKLTAATESRTFKYSKTMEVSRLELNATGLYLYNDGDEKSEDDSIFVVGVRLRNSSFRVAQLGYGGRFLVRSFIGGDWVEEVSWPVEFCEIPFSCGKMGLCVSEKNTGFCTCPDGFVVDSRKGRSCVPKDNSFVLPSSCDATAVSGKKLDSTNVSYAKLGSGVDYFANDFTEPLVIGVFSLSECQLLCSRNCSCLGIFYGNSSGYCYFLEGSVGSFMSNGVKDRLGYMKTLVVPYPKNTNEDKKKDLPKLIEFVVIPLSGFFLVMIILVVAVLWLCRRRHSRKTVVNLGRLNSSSSVELGMISVPGLPSRFEYDELVEATENFKTQIGSGGFGTVYKGTMSDETVVAVKKITNLGVRGKKEFCTETAIIGSIHHVNLVRLKGFCIYGSERFLVYEYMSRGSLEKLLFGKGPVLEWEDRFKIALGTARALAYLHCGCQQKIIHCDIKPENILLNDSLVVKISDFGLSKLLDHKNSKLITTLRGTRGYLAPEWLTISGITDKTDVYSFGMVLLEIVSGKRNCSFAQDSSMVNDGGEDNGSSFFSSSTEQRPVFFPSLALEMHRQRRYLDLADLRLDGQVSSKDVEKIVKIALCCLHIVPVLRPTMDKVVAMLEDRVPLDEPRVEALNFLKSFGGRHS